MKPHLWKSLTLPSDLCVVMGHLRTLNEEFHIAYHVLDFLRLRKVWVYFEENYFFFFF